MLYIANIGDDDPEITLSWEHKGSQWFTKEELLDQDVPENCDPYYSDVLNWLQNTNSN